MERAREAGWRLLWRLFLIWAAAIAFLVWTHASPPVWINPTFGHPCPPAPAGAVVVVTNGCRP